MNPSLVPSDFPDYFEALWGYMPFPWQSRLVESAWREGRFPSLLDLPTGVGKTSVLDIAVFLMALGADTRSDVQPRFPRRAFLIVDRRVVVDQAAERAREIADKLASPSNPILQRIAERLQRLAGHTDEDAMPLAWTQLRGGMARDEGWAHDPAQPLIGASTVDQIGSRLLFRGYGISDGAKPIHAGLLGHDTLLFLDEVHLSESFRRTLGSVSALRKRAKGSLPTRWQVIEMSATPGNTSPDVFRLDQDKAHPDRQHPTLKKRLQASKPAQTRAIEVKGGEAKKREILTREAVTEIQNMLTRYPHVRTPALVVNRVDTARHAAHLLKKAGVEHILLTGRSRPLDRDRVLAEHSARIRAGRSRDPSAKPFVVVATQCIEAGADFDFDALVTECASLDALRQRFGRVDRLGDLHEAGLSAPGIILARSDQLDEDADDPVYGEALKETFRWLDALDQLNFGIEHMEAGSNGKLLGPQPRTPELLGGHLDLWSQTRPRPHADADVSLWLHGIQENVPDVLVVWRADLDNRTDEPDGDGHLDPESQKDYWLDAITALPPNSLEAVSLPLWAVKSWFAGNKPLGPADVEGSRHEDSAKLQVKRKTTFLLWRGDDSSVSDDLDEIRPGDTIVIPSQIGGLDAHGNWDPSARDKVDDIAELANLLQRGRPTLRLLPGLWTKLPSDPPRPNDTRDEETPDDKSQIAEFLRLLSQKQSNGEIPTQNNAGENRLRILQPILAQARRKTLRHIQVGKGEQSYWLLQAKRLSPEALRKLWSETGITGEPDSGEFSNADESASFIAKQVPLRTHLRGVGRLARNFADTCGLPAPLREAVSLAAELHDLGKADPRFQALLCGGDRALAAALLADDEPIAKSHLPATAHRLRNFAREQAGWPQGGRHELLSVEMAKPVVRDVLAKRLPDTDGQTLAHLESLVLHLIASHHGWCRPFPPAIKDSYPRQSTLEFDGVRYTAPLSPQRYSMGSGAADRFWEMTRHYGWWGLAWLETLVRLADHRRSEWEATHDVENSDSTPQPKEADMEEST